MRQKRDVVKRQPPSPDDQGMHRPSRPTLYVRAGSLLALVAVIALLVSGVNVVRRARAGTQARGQAAIVASSLAAHVHTTPSSGRAVATAGTAAPASFPATSAPVSGAAQAGRTGRTTTTTAPPQATTTTAPAHATTIPAPPATTPTAGSATQAAGSVLFGVVTDTNAELASFDADAGKNATLYGSYRSFAYSSDFDSASASALRSQGVQPMVTWEPWDPGVGTANQPTYSLASILAGNFDTYITRWATEIKAWGQPLWLRFAHEMNGNWYPWSAGVNGNSADQYVAAWRHVHDIFQRVGATNVSWVWTPNVIMGATPTLASLYPGDAYVDVIGMDGYNWGTSQSWGSTWQTPSQVFGQTLAALEQISSRPEIIGETASTEIGGNKATWINQFFAFLAAQPRIKAFVWFNLNKETDWRIESSAAAEGAFAAGVANRRYS